MSKRQVLIVLALWIIIFLFLGFPSRYEKILAIVTGLLIMIVAYRIRTPRSTEQSDTFVERKMSDISRPDSPSNS